MQTITKEYLLLFNTLTDAEEALRRLETRLIEAQRRAEELFLEEGEQSPQAGQCPTDRVTVSPS